VARLLVALTVLPVAALLTWLAFGVRPQRADFVVAYQEPRTLDPHRVSWAAEIQLANTLFEGLTRLNAETFQPEPAVAARWEVNQEQTRYTFHLRPQARWSNGDPVVAEHFRFAWLRVLDPPVESQYASLLFVIAGAEDYYRSRLNGDASDDVPAERVGIGASDAHTLRVRLVGPCSYFLDLTSFPTLAPVHPPTLERWAYREGRVLRGTRHLWTRPGNLVCNGAFILSGWDFKQRLLLQRNPHYWDAGNIHVDSIEVYLTADLNADLIAYETGRVDLVQSLETAVARVLRGEQQAGRRSDFHLGDRFATCFLRVNCRRPPLDNADLRKALALAIDKPAICTQVLGLGETPADTYVPRGALHLMTRAGPKGETTYYHPPDGLAAGLSYAERVELARAHLRRSGFERVAATRPIEITYAPHPDIQRVAEAVQAMWESALGIRVELRVVEPKVLNSKINSLDYDVARCNWFGDYLDPSTFLNMFRTHDGQNRTGWSHAEYDRLLAAAGSEADNARRFALFRAAERILCEQQVPIIPLYFRRGAFLLNPAFTGLKDNVRDILPIHRVRQASSVGDARDF
jgi:oligopeptide transport system substrate-binding protein